MKKEKLHEEIKKNSGKTFVVITDEGSIYGSNASLSTLMMGGGKLFILDGDYKHYLNYDNFHCFKNNWRYTLDEVHNTLKEALEF